MHACMHAPPLPQGKSVRVNSHRTGGPWYIGGADWDAVVEYFANSPNGSVPLRAHLLADHRPCRIGGGKKRYGVQ